MKIDEKLNHQAYMDVLDCKPQRYPDDEEYIKHYNFWRPLQKFPGDDFDHRE
ncbi:MAG: hypothetical protein ACOC1K_01280 [Nanoarchaeota archaeon]